jgi:hypothetical protein
MNTKDLLKRTYYAVTMAGMMLFVTLFLIVWPMPPFGMTESLWLYKGVSFSALLSLAVCWIMTRHNKPTDFKWYAGVIIAVTLIYFYLPLFDLHIPRLSIPIETKTYILLTAYAICAVVSTFLSNTKYHNILPNQSKGVSTLFRVVSWIGQIGIWAIVVAIGVDEIARVVDKDYYKKQYEKVEKARAKRLQLYEDNH